MPTLIALVSGSLTVLMTHGLKTGAPVFQSTELADSSGKFELLLEGAQGVEAVVVLVVAERGGVVADLVHRGRHGVRRAAGDRVDLGVVVRERCALDRVAGVDRQGALGADLGTDRLDDRRRLGDADVVGLAVGVLDVLEVVPVVDVAVQVGRAEDGQSDDLAVGARTGRCRSGGGGLGRAHGREAGAADGGEGQQLATGGRGSEEVRGVVGAHVVLRCQVLDRSSPGARCAARPRGAGHDHSRRPSTQRPTAVVGFVNPQRRPTSQSRILSMRSDTWSDEAAARSGPPQTRRRSMWTLAWGSPFWRA